MGRVVIRKQLRRGQVLEFFGRQPPCVVAMEACGGAHFWGRELTKLGHEVRLIPPAYVKPHVEAPEERCRRRGSQSREAAQRPTMRLKAVKSEESQAAAVIFRTRDLLVWQRTQLINALRGHMAEFGLVVPQGAARAKELIAMVADPDALLPHAARSALHALVSALDQLEVEIRSLEVEIVRRAKDDEVARRLMTIPGVGPLIATALVALAPPPETFWRGRDFAAWLGLTPRQHSTGGKQRLGATTKMGERSLRRLLIIGANSVVIKRAVHRQAQPGTWLGGLLARKPPMLVRVALANKMARVVWALMAKGEDYRAPAVAA